MSPAATGPLSPSQEEAYRIKCMELTTRMKEVATENDQLRLRKERLTRGIKKMRLERAILLDAIKQRMPKDDADENEDPDSEDSSDSPPTPKERPLRTKKSHRRITTSPPRNSQAAAAENDATAAGAAGGTDAPSATGAGGDVSDAPKADTIRSAAASAEHRTAGVAGDDYDSDAFRAFAAHLLNDVLPTDPNSEAEVLSEFANDYQAYARKKWSESPESERARWDRDPKGGRGGKKGGGRASKVGSGDVEMKDAADY